MLRPTAAGRRTLATALSVVRSQWTRRQIRGRGALSQRVDHERFSPEPSTSGATSERGGEDGEAGDIVGEQGSLLVGTQDQQRLSGSGKGSERTDASEREGIRWRALPSVP
jgi:hypothetical protein